MRRSTVVLAVTILFFAFIAYSLAAKNEKLNWPTYKGAWFAINYPKGFQPRPSIQSPTSETGYDSVFFVSPDQKTIFYVFSPKETGDPSDIALNPQREMEIDRKLTRNKKGYDLAVTIVERPTKARSVGKSRQKDKYIRYIFGTQNLTGLTTRTFCAMYRDSKSRAKYKDDFQKFRASLEKRTK